MNKKQIPGEKKEGRADYRSVKKCHAKGKENEHCNKVVLSRTKENIKGKEETEKEDQNDWHTNK